MRAQVQPPASLLSWFAMLGPALWLPVASVTLRCSANHGCIAKHQAMTPTAACSHWQCSCFAGDYAASEDLALFPMAALRLVADNASSAVHAHSSARQRCVQPPETDHGLASRPAGPEGTVGPGPAGSPPQLTPPPSETPAGWQHPSPVAMLPGLS